MDRNRENDYADKKNYFRKRGGVKSLLKYSKGEVPKKVDVSICIPTFQRVDELKKAVQSVILLEKQKIRLVWNLIIVDNELSELDNSSPKRRLLEAVEGISLKYYQNEENIGLFGNWNRCIELADGMWVAMLHDDDLLDYDYLKAIEDIVLHIDYETVAYIKANARTESPTNVVKESLKSKYRCHLIHYRKSDIELLTPDLIGTLGAPTCGTLINKKLFLKVGGYNEQHYPNEDAYVAAKLINLFGYKVYKTIGYMGTYQWNVNASFKKETLMGNARELKPYLEYYRKWGKIAKFCYAVFRNEIIWNSYRGMERLVKVSEYISDKENMMRELRAVIGMPKERKLRMKIYIILKRLHNWILIGRGILFGKNYAKSKKTF